MPIPVVRHEQAAQVRMAEKAHAKKIKDLALEKISAAPHAGHRFHAGISTRQQHFQPHPLFAAVRKQVIDDFETRFLRITVNTRNVGKKNECELSKLLHAS